MGAPPKLEGWQTKMWAAYVRNEQGAARRNKALWGSAGPAQPDPNAPAPPKYLQPALAAAALTSASVTGPILPAFIVPLPDRFRELRHAAGRLPRSFPPWEGHAHWGCKEEAHTLLHPCKL